MKAKQILLTAAVAVLAAAAGWMARGVSAQAAEKRVFELRTYTAVEGRLPDLLARFRNHTVKLFTKHGMANIGYWVPQDDPGRQTTLVYLLAHKDREAAKKSWDAFRNDPAWQKAREASEAKGKIVSKIDSVFLDPTDFSPLQ